MQRISMILSASMGRLSQMRRLCFYCCLGVCVISQITGQIAAAQTTTSPQTIATGKATSSKTPVFDTVSIRLVEKPKFPDWWGGAQPQGTADGYRSNEQSLWGIIMLAYYQTSKSPLYWKRNMLSGVPAWLMKNHYDIDARVAPEDIEAWQKPDPERTMLRNTLQQMLIERCKLVLHSTTTEQPVYALEIKPGAKLKLKEADPDEIIPKGAQRFAYDGAIESVDHKSTWRFYNVSMNYVIAYLTAFGADRPVIDRTGLKGRYDFVLSGRPHDAGEPADTTGFPEDLESIGLTLKPMKASMETLVIDHIEEPSAN
jgi:uncharacterized protein (TIGR03435 family)